MARKWQKPEDWPGVPDESKPSEPYAILDADAAEWIAAACAWVSESVRDGRRRKSALRAIPHIYRLRERGEVTQDGRPFYARGFRTLAKAARIGEKAARSALDTLSGSGSTRAPLEAVAEAGQHRPAIYKLSDPASFGAESITVRIKAHRSGEEPESVQSCPKSLQSCPNSDATEKVRATLNTSQSSPNSGDRATLSVPRVPLTQEIGQPCGAPECPRIAAPQINTEEKERLFPNSSYPHTPPNMYAQQPTEQPQHSVLDTYPSAGEEEFEDTDIPDESLWGEWA